MAKVVKKRPSFFKCPECLGYFKTAKKKTHFCVKSTEESLTQVLDEDGKGAWLALRAFAVGLGDQRIYTSAKAIMFSRRICYFFVRPKSKRLELTFFLNHELKSPIIHSVKGYSKIKFAHTVHLNHEDQIEVPLTDWLREARELAG